MAVRAVEHRMSELNQPQRAILMLKMRRHQNKFMLRGEDSHRDENRQKEPLRG